MIIGPPGIGKTTAAASAPKAVILATEDGCDDIGCDRTPLLQTMAEFDTALMELGTGDHGYRTVVVDSIDWLERLIWQQVCDDANKTSVKTIEDIGYKKGYIFAMKYWDATIAKLDRLRLGKNMSVILVSHSKTAKVDPPDGESYTRYEPALHPNAAALIREWCDEVLFANYKVFSAPTGEGFNKRNLAVGGDERVFHTCEKPSHLAKSRIDMPDEITLSWESYAGYVRAAYEGYKSENNNNINGIVVDGSSKPKTEKKDNG